MLVIYNKELEDRNDSEPPLEHVSRLCFDDFDDDCLMTDC